MKANASLVAGVLALGLVFALPLAGALSWGIDSTSVDDLKSAGVTPSYGQTWVGTWIKQSGWSAFEAELRTMRDQGVTPVVMWYYWGDAISVDCVKYGCGGRSKSDWDAMAGEMARRANAIMGGKTWFVVLEPEFQKNGIQSWETFDVYLESQAWNIRGKAPTAKVVVGFGHWGGWDIFDRAVAASHHTGFQILRGSTRDSSAQGENAAGDIVRIGKELKARWGKPVLMYDLGIATYGGWEGVQEKALQNIAARKGEIESAGVFAIVWRYMYDNGHSSGYYGAAESSWGVKYANGGAKRGYDDLLALMRGGGSAADTTAPVPGAFSGVSGNNWWIQAKATGTPRAVQASVNGGSPVAMAWQSWGAWAVSTSAPTGSVVTLTATYADGSVARASYAWPSATLTTATAGTTVTTSTATFDATFSAVTGNTWWVQTKVAGSKPVASVAARVDGGAWTTLTKYDWGYAKSIRAPSGSTVEFRATSTTGETATSRAYTW